MASNGQVNLSSAIERHTGVDGEHHTAVPALRLYRFSAPSDLVAVVLEASLCVVAQGSKEAHSPDGPFEPKPQPTGRSTPDIRHDSEEMRELLAAALAAYRGPLGEADGV